MTLWTTANATLRARSRGTIGSCSSSARPVPARPACCKPLYVTSMHRRDR
jgi:hypothetical protein